MRLLTNDVLADLLEATRLTFQEQRADEMSAKATVALLRAVSEAQDAKTAAAMQVELDEGMAECGKHLFLLRETETERDDLREKGQALADAGENMLKEDSGVPEWEAWRRAWAAWNTT